MAEGHVEEVGNVLPLVIHPTLDYTSAQSLSRLARRLNACLERGTRSPKIAILGSFTTGPLLPFMELFLFAARMKAEFYEADYGVFRQDVLDPTSSLHQFRPDILVLATCWRNWAPGRDSAAGRPRCSLESMMRSPAGCVSGGPHMTSPDAESSRTTLNSPPGVRWATTRCANRPGSLGS